METIANQKVDKYLVDGCMRCKFGATPNCKVNNWRDELTALRHLVLESGLTEDLKWGMPCYTDNGKNILMVTAFKEYCSLSFFKGSLMKDADNVLVSPGENSQAMRYMKFTDLGEIVAHQEQIKAYIAEAIAIEKAGKKVQFKKEPESMPDELLTAFEEYDGLKEAFERLTPGRQRAYILYFSQSKEAKTRMNRIEKCRKKIQNGEGLNDEYSG
jgi:uncharacterized protein YdeI (YjbR/CyaY-like superfamily)